MERLPGPLGPALFDLLLKQAGANGAA